MYVTPIRMTPCSHVIGLHKYSAAVYDACLESFNALPVAAIVDHRFFCVHGGLSPELTTLDDLHEVYFVLLPRVISD